jgi:CIC family chloride channel protein
MVGVAVAIGLAGALGAVLFRFLIRFFQAGFFAGSSGVEAVVMEPLAEAGDPLDLVRALPWYLVALAPALGGLVVGPLVYFFAREAKGHGVPEVMEAVALRGGAIRSRVVAIKTLASAISIGSGGSVGREGPIVHIGSAIGSTLGQLLKVPARDLRTLVGCGAAAGIAATFNAPIAGALFAAEVILGNFAISQFSPIVISSVVATVLSRYILGDYPAFEVPPYELVSPFELVPYVGVGVIAALVGVAFTSILYASEDGFERLAIPPYLKAAVGGALVGLIGIFLPNVFGVGYGTITQALRGELTLQILGLLLVAKIAATSITIGSGGSGGVFAPSLFLGAVTGGLFGTLIHQAFPDATAGSGAYALVTMGAVVAATTHAPITAILIIFEMTQTIAIIPPLMAACVVSTIVAMLLRRESIYTMKLIRRGVDLKQEQDPNALKGIYVRDIVNREPEVIHASSSFQTVIDLIVESDHSEFFVVDAEQRLVGSIYLRKLRRLLAIQEDLRPIVVAGDIVETDRPTVTENDTLDVVMQIFARSDLDEIGVVDEGNRGKLIGSVHKRDVMGAYNQEMLRRDLLGGVSSTVNAVERGQQVALGGGYVLQEILAPRAFKGHSLEELDVRAKTGVHVLLIRSRESSGTENPMRVPTPSDRIQEGDVLVIAGPAGSVNDLERV